MNIFAIICMSIVLFYAYFNNFTVFCGFNYVSLALYRSLCMVG